MINPFKIFVWFLITVNIIIAIIGIENTLSAFRGRDWPYGPRRLSVVLTEKLNFESPALLMSMFYGVVAIGDGVMIYLEISGLVDAFSEVVLALIFVSLGLSLFNIYKYFQDFEKGH